MTGFAHGALLLAGLFQVATTAQPICVVVSEERADARAAAGAALGALEGSVRLTATQARAADLSERCGGIVALGPAAWSATRSTGTIPVVTALVPASQIATDGPAAAVLAEPDPSAILDTLRTLAPQVRRVGMVYDPDMTGALVAAVEEAAGGRDLEIVALVARDQASAIRAFHRFEREVDVDALWILPDRTTTTYETAHQALKLAHWKRIPVVGPSRWYVANGALFAYETAHEAHGRVAAERLRSLMDEAQVPPVSYPPGGSLLVNRRTLDRLGLRMTSELQGRVSEFIQ